MNNTRKVRRMKRSLLLKEKIRTKRIRKIRRTKKVNEND